ncbi:TraR/DksA C4-type zinc finger protein [Nocardioides sp.]|uniref:TraR/DksA family transcriptional regulator n=1 Tax=Nocardioides sp. TaxID=35761 RepID=UPI00272187EB|nr:TraR/DksA C4-type zinc finger protein [Nocardioides sp.]MDO9456583.1 TraR/DksA C4-type zinc finger protein [Nocardioides sp.]
MSHDPRARLQAERRRTTDRLARLRGDFDEVVAASRDTNADDEHDPEGATIAFERSQIDTLVRLADRHLVEVDAALARVDAGTYGRCEVCGRDIAPERLEVRPTARTCVSCA